MYHSKADVQKANHYMEGFRLAVNRSGRCRIVHTSVSWIKKMDAGAYSMLQSADT